MRSPLERMYEPDTDFAPCVHHLSFRRSGRSQPLKDSRICCPLAFSAETCQYDSPDHIPTFPASSCKLRPAVGASVGWQRAQHNTVQILCTLVEYTFCPPPQTPIAIARVQVDNHQQMQSPSVKQRIRDKIYSPDGLGDVGSEAAVVGAVRIGYGEIGATVSACSRKRR